MELTFALCWHVPLSCMIPKFVEFVGPFPDSFCSCLYIMKSSEQDSDFCSGLQMNGQTYVNEKAREK